MHKPKYGQLLRSQTWLDNIMFFQEFYIQAREDGTETNDTIMTQTGQTDEPALPAQPDHVSFNINSC